jgi:hypothetical protein
MARANIRRLKARSAAAAFLLLTAFVGIGSWTTCLSAQTITIRLLNAKSGNPMGSKMVTIQWRKSWDQSVIAFDNHGLGTVDVPSGEHEFTIIAGPKVGKEPNRTPYIDCNETRMELLVQVSLVLEKGYVLENRCGRKSAVAHPGEIVFWVLPNPWWEPDMQ